MKQISSDCDLFFAQTFGSLLNRDYHVGTWVMNGENQRRQSLYKATAFEGNLRNAIEVFVLYI
jgi:hypothetical protein